MTRWLTLGACLAIAGCGGFSDGLDEARPVESLDPARSWLSAPRGPCSSLHSTQVSSADFRIWEGHERVGDSRAQSPEYIFLEMDVDALALPGPTLLGGYDGVDLVDLVASGAIIERDNHTGVAFEVTLPEIGARYMLLLRDLEFELNLAEVELCRRGGALESTFVLVGVGGGVVYDITIDVTADGASSGATEPVTVEVRPG